MNFQYIVTVDRPGELEMVPLMVSQLGNMLYHLVDGESMLRLVSGRVR